MPPTAPDRPKSPHSRPLSIRIALLAMALVALLVPSAVQAMQSKRVAKESENATLGETVLTTNKGKTLYSLSVEKKGKFICTGGCLSLWKPLVVPAGVKPKGPVKLGTVKRPDGRTQVTYKGLPLYSFNADKPGEANGQGLKDVGTWHAAKVSKVSSPPPAPQPESPPYPY
ncbi:MAG: COG4315 family predicted lipoprotein [Solirubrobacterales bacterium]